MTSGEWLGGLSAVLTEPTDGQRVGLAAGTAFLLLLLLGPLVIRLFRRLGITEACQKTDSDEKKPNEQSDNSPKQPDTKDKPIEMQAEPKASSPPTPKKSSKQESGKKSKKGKRKQKLLSPGVIHSPRKNVKQGWKPQPVPCDSVKQGG